MIADLCKLVHFRKHQVLPKFPGALVVSHGVVAQPLEQGLKEFLDKVVLRLPRLPVPPKFGRNGHRQDLAKRDRWHRAADDEVQQRGQLGRLAPRKTHRAGPACCNGWFALKALISASSTPGARSFQLSFIDQNGMSSAKT